MADVEEVVDTGDFELSTTPAGKTADEGKSDGQELAEQVEERTGGGSNPHDLLDILHDTAQRLQKNAKYEQAVKVLVQALHLEVELYGKVSETVNDSATRLIKMCNKLAVKMLKVGKFEMCIAFLARGLKLTDPSFLPKVDALRIVTFNNASSCYRRLGDMDKALEYAKDALSVGLAANREDSLACSHLNICCVHSQNGDHEAALRHAQDALAAALQTVRSNGSNSTVGNGIDVNDPQRKQKLATLCISYHNTGVELEHLKRYEECLGMYEKALQVAEMHLPDNRGMAHSFKQSYKAAKLIAAELGIKFSRPQLPQPLKPQKRPKSASATNLHKPKQSQQRHTRSSMTLEIKAKTGAAGQRPQSAGPSGRQSSKPQIAYSFRSAEEEDEPRLLPPLEGADEFLLSAVPGSESAEAPKDGIQSVSMTDREQELERKLAMMQQRVAQLEAKLDPKHGDVSDSILFRRQLDALHQRTQDALEAAEANATKIEKNRVKVRKKRPKSAGVVRGQRGTASMGSLAAKRMANAGMVVTGPGITTGQGPVVSTKRKRAKKKPPPHQASAPALTAVEELDKMQRRPAEAGSADEDLGAHKTSEEGASAGEKEEKIDGPVMGQVEDEAALYGGKVEDIGATMGDGAPVGGSPSRQSPNTSPTSRSKKFDRTPQKLTGAELVKFLGGNTISEYGLKTYLGAHHSSATVSDRKGQTPLQALCGNPRATKDMIMSYLSVHPAHIVEARGTSDEGKTALHYLATNKVGGTVDMAKVLLNEYPAALNTADRHGKTPLIICYEQSLSKLASKAAAEVSQKLLKYLLKRSAVALPDEQFGNNQLHLVLWCLARTTITPDSALQLTGDLIQLKPSLVLQPNQVGVTPAGMAQSCFSKKIQKLVKKAVDDNESADIPEDALNLLETMRVEKARLKAEKKGRNKSKPKLKTRGNPFRDPPPNYDTMPQCEREAKRVFFLLHETIEARHERPIILFIKMDQDESGTITADELRKGLMDLHPGPGIKITRRQASSIFKTLAKTPDGSGELSYREIVREIKKVSRYPKPPEPSEEEQALIDREVEEDKARRLEEKRLARKNGRKKKTPFLLTDEHGVFQVGRVFSKMFLTIEERQLQIMHFFMEIDKDESGVINGKELRAGLKETLKIDLTNEQFKEVMHAIDEDHSDSIDYKELAGKIKKANPRREASRLRREKQMKKAQANAVPVVGKKKKKTLGQLKKSSPLTSLLHEAEETHAGSAEAILTQPEDIAASIQAKYNA